MSYLKLFLTQRDGQPVLMAEADIVAGQKGYYTYQGGLASGMIRVFVPYQVPPSVHPTAYHYSPLYGINARISGGWPSDPLGPLDPSANPLTRNHQPNPDLLAWEGAIGISDAWIAANPAATSGGVTRVVGRNFRAPNTNSTNLNNTLNAMHLGTQQLVEFHNCAFAGFGGEGTAQGITGGTYNQRVRFYNCKFYGLQPSVVHFTRGRALQFDGPAEVVVDHCDFYSTAGIYLGGWVGYGRNLPNTIVVTNNRFFELDGRVADPGQPALYPGGPSGWMIGNQWGGSGPNNNLWHGERCQIANCTAVGQVGTGRVYANNELRAGATIQADAHSGGAMTFNIIDRDLLLGTETVIGAATLSAGATSGSVSIPLPQMIRTGRQIKLVSTAVAAGASATNVRVNFECTRMSSFKIANMIQINNAQNIDRVLIANNLIRNTANNNRCEDLVSLYRCKGTPTSPIRVENNLFLGGSEVYDPWFDPNNPGMKMFGNNMPQDWPERYDYRGYASSGGQGLLGDGNGDTDLGDPAFCEMRNMTVIGTTNYAIGVAGGHDMLIEDSNVFRSGYLFGLDRDVVIAWGHAGLQIQDYNTDSRPWNSINFAAGIGRSVPLGRTNEQGQTMGPRWYNIRARRIRGNYTWRDANGNITKQATEADPSTLILANSPIAESTGHIIIPNVSREMENSEIVAHLARWTAAGIAPGVTSA